MSSDKKTRERKFHPANFTTTQFHSLINLPALEKSESMTRACETAQSFAGKAYEEASITTLPGSGPVDPQVLFGEPAPETLADAFLMACGGDQQKADLVQANANLTREVDRLRETLAEALAKLNGEDHKIFPFLQVGEKNVFASQSTHEHAQAVLLPLPTGVRALWATMLLRVRFGGYITDNFSELMKFARIEKSAFHAHLNVLIDRGIVAEHPKGLIINPAIAQCFARSEQFAKRQEFAVFHQSKTNRRHKGTANDWGHSNLSGEQPVQRVLVDPLGKEATVRYADGGIGAYIGVVSPNHAELILSEHSEKKRTKFRATGQKRALKGG